MNYRLLIEALSKETRADTQSVIHTGVPTVLIYFTGALVVAVTDRFQMITEVMNYYLKC